MQPRENVHLALNHQEPERVPLDIGGTDVSGINVHTYRELLRSVGLDATGEIPVLDVVQQIADINETMFLRLESHFRPIFPNPPSNWKFSISKDETHQWFKDEWGITWTKPNSGGFYYDIAESPLANASIEDIENYPWPDPDDPDRYVGLVDQARKIYEDGKFAVVLSGITGGGPMEVASWLFGFENFFVALLTEPQKAGLLLDKVLEIKLKFWNNVLPEIHPYIDVISESEDLGMQDRLLISPRTFRKQIKPRLKALVEGVKQNAGNAKFMLHSDGAIVDVLPDLIEIGVDILNPVQVSAKGMGDTAFLKREFGKDLVFWGGVDNQFVLSFGTPEKVKEEVKRRINDLSHDGGYILAPVHNIQANTPPENIIAMLEAWREYGRY